MLETTVDRRRSGSSRSRYELLLHATRCGTSARLVGNVRRGDATRRSVTDAFISDLVLATRPSLDGERLESPADAVLIRRCGIAAEWADALERVPDEHLAWNGWVLEKSLA